MDLTDARYLDRTSLERHLRRGLAAFGVPEPVSLVDFADRHFYLSAESSYVEQQFRAWPFQRAILACLGNDAIREVDCKKSARVGWTKILLAAIAYYAAHKRRNQAIWQPTDDDRDEFVKSEVDPMLRDVAVMRDVLPQVAARDKDNTLKVKRFTGSLLYLRGGKAAKNYRRISVGFAAIDELDAFDADIEKEGDPATLASKRVEGATFPKFAAGSTPKLRGFSLIEARELRADARYTYQICCPSCSGRHALTWFGEDQTHGFKWVGDDPATVKHLCPHCGVLIGQGEYLAAAEGGLWVGDDKSTIDHAGVFRNAAGDVMKPHAHVAFHVWTAYSPAVGWPDIVREYLAAEAKASEGDELKIKAFTNTTLGLAYEGEVERTEAETLKQRAEPFSLRVVPMGCLLLLAGVDTQDNRLEVGVWGFGRGSEMWTIDHQVLFGNPGEDEVWQRLRQYLVETTFPHQAGTEIRITASALDTGGHYTHAAYEFARENKSHGVFAVRGRHVGEKHIKEGSTLVDIDWRGRRRKAGVVLWHVGTNHAKDLLFGRLKVPTQGPGYIHFSNQLSDEWFRQYTGEIRATMRNLNGSQSRWTATRKRVEALDCAVYAVWLEAHLELVRKPASWWDSLEERVQPATRDLFSAPALASGPPSPPGAAPAGSVTTDLAAPLVQSPPAAAPRPPVAPVRVPGTGGKINLAAHRRFGGSNVHQR